MVVIEVFSGGRLRTTHRRPDVKSSKANTRALTPHAELQMWLHVRNYQERTSVPDSSLTKSEGRTDRLGIPANSTPIPWGPRAHFVSTSLEGWLPRWIGLKFTGRAYCMRFLFQHTNGPRQQEESMANSRVVSKGVQVWLGNRFDCEGAFYVLIALWERSAGQSRYFFDHGGILCLFACD